jgi:hypothetical protein
MQTPQFLLDLLQLLLDLAVPAAFCTLAAAGVSLRHEGGINFHVNGRAGKWILWTIVLLTLPQLLSWVAAQGINIPSASGSVGTSWLASMEIAIKTSRCLKHCFAVFPMSACGFSSGTRFPSISETF